MPFVAYINLERFSSCPDSAVACFQQFDQTLGLIEDCSSYVDLQHISQEGEMNKKKMIVKQFRIIGTKSVEEPVSDLTKVLLFYCDTPRPVFDDNLIFDTLKVWDQFLASFCHVCCSLYCLKLSWQPNE